jgi:hypothetical protein
MHQEAARRVLHALLPEVGTDIKGHMRSHAELLEASGYGNRPDNFNGLLRILDGQLRLITPTERVASDEWRVAGEKGIGGEERNEPARSPAIGSLADEREAGGALLSGHERMALSRVETAPNVFCHRRLRRFLGETGCFEVGAQESRRRRPSFLIE